MSELAAGQCLYFLFCFWMSYANSFPDLHGLELLNQGAVKQTRNLHVREECVNVDPDACRNVVSNTDRLIRFGHCLACTQT